MGAPMPDIIAQGSSFISYASKMMQGIGSGVNDSFMIFYDSSRWKIFLLFVYIYMIKVLILHFNFFVRIFLCECMETLGPFKIWKNF